MLHRRLMVADLRDYQYQVVRRRPENIPVPYELRDYISPDKWDSRIMQIKMLCTKYSKPIFERIWFVFAFL